MRAALRGCKRHVDITTCKERYQAKLIKMHRAGGETKTQAIIIQNLIHYMRKCVREGWV